MLRNFPYVAAATLTLMCTPVHADEIHFGLFGGATTTTGNAIGAQGHSHAVLSDLSSGSLSGVNVLWVQNSNPLAQPSALSTYASDVASFVSAGGILVYHDRHVTDAASVLPDGDSLNIVRQLSNDIGIVNDSTLVTDGPGGTIGNGTLDNGGYSQHGYTEASSLPDSAMAILSTGNLDEIVDFLYEFGSGYVYYSTIPLDFHLDSSDSGNTLFGSSYTPNIIAYLAQLAQQSSDDIEDEGSGTTDPPPGSITSTPEPTSLALWAVSALGVGIGAARRRRNMG